jgi:ribonuclease D
MVKHRVSLPKPTIVTSAQDMRAMLDHLTDQPVVAVDTESNSLYAYHERVCLVQFSAPGQDYLLDPFAVDDLSPLGALFDDDRVEKVFHAAEYDVMVLRRDYGFEFDNLFDTMLASRIVGWPRYGLGSLLKEHFGVQTDKRMQRTNWGRRPLKSSELTYAQLDTHYLIPLRDRLLDELEEKNRVEEARIAFERVSQSEWTERTFDPDGFWRIKGVRKLDDTELAVLRALYVYRDHRAQAMDRPPFKVFSDQILVSLSQKRPSSLSQLARTKGLPRRLPVRAQKQILKVIQRATKDDPPKRPERTGNRRMDEVTLQRYETLRTWRKERAERRGVEPDVVLSNHTLHALAWRNPTSSKALADSGTLNEWQQHEYGPEIVSLLQEAQTR